MDPLIPFPANISSEPGLDCLCREELLLLRQLLLEHYLKAVIVKLFEVLLLLIQGQRDSEGLLIGFYELLLLRILSTWPR